MFTHKDIENKSVFVINGLAHQNLRVKSGFLYLEDLEKEKALTKFPFPKILFLMVIGHTNITSALIDQCNKHKIPMVVMKPNFRSVFYFGNFADANYLLRKKQHLQPAVRLDIAQFLVNNKLSNQLCLLQKTRKKDALSLAAVKYLEQAMSQVALCTQLGHLMALEGRAAKHFFGAYFQDFQWKGRRPRVKQDPLNACLDIAYTNLFNFIENMCRLFGFDLYVGVYHQLWFKRKSLICDLIEPFRCIVEHQVRKSFNYGTFSSNDFQQLRGSYYLRYGVRKKYTQAIFEAIIAQKLPIFKYIQDYYRCFMGNKSVEEYPVFEY